MKMDPLLALILWVQKPKVFQVRRSLPSGFGLIFGNFYGGWRCQFRTVSLIGKNVGSYPRRAKLPPNSSSLFFTEILSRGNCVSQTKNFVGTFPSASSVLGADPVRF